MLRFLVGFLGTGINALPMVTGGELAAAAGTLWVHPFSVGPPAVRPQRVRPAEIITP